MAIDNSGNSDNVDSRFAEDALEHSIRELESLAADFNEMAAAIEPLVQARLQRLAGPHLQTMLSSAAATVQFLTHVDPQVRQAALQLAYRHWNITNKLASQYERMAFSDSDTEVRDTAIRALGTCYARTKHARIGHLLAALVRDESVSEGIRLTAFTSLLRLHRNIEYSGNSPLVPQHLHEIDWRFVDDYYHGWRPETKTEQEGGPG
jgi:hypothetical protein